MNKAGIFVDVQNIYYTTREYFGRPFNYRAFRQLISQQYDIQCAYAYAIKRNDDQQIKFQDALRHIGFEVKLKNFIQRKDGSAKGDWDVGITIDIIEHAKELDEIILLSGDGDFAVLLDHIKHKYQTRTIVYGTKALTAESLINSAHQFVPIGGSLLITSNS